MVVMERTDDCGCSQGRGCNYGPWSEWKAGLGWIDKWKCGWDRGLHEGKDCSGGDARAS